MSRPRREGAHLQRLGGVLEEHELGGVRLRRYPGPAGPHWYIAMRPGAPAAARYAALVWLPQHATWQGIPAGAPSPEWSEGGALGACRWTTEAAAASRLRDERLRYDETWRG